MQFKFLILFFKWSQTSSFLNVLLEWNKNRQILSISNIYEMVSMVTNTKKKLSKTDMMGTIGYYIVLY